MGDDVVAERLEFEARKRLVDAFGLLQADHVGLALLEPGHQRLDPLPDRINVPGGNAHGLFLLLGRRILWWRLRSPRAYSRARALSGEWHLRILCRSGMGGHAAFEADGKTR